MVGGWAGRPVLHRAQRLAFLVFAAWLVLVATARASSLQVDAGVISPANYHFRQVIIRLHGIADLPADGTSLPTAWVGLTSAWDRLPDQAAACPSDPEDMASDPNFRTILSGGAVLPAWDINPAAVGDGSYSQQVDFSPTRMEEPGLWTVCVLMATPARNVSDPASGLPVQAPGELLVAATTFTLKDLAPAPVRPAPVPPTPHRPARPRRPAVRLVRRSETGEPILVPAGWRFADRTYPSDHSTLFYINPRDHHQKMRIQRTSCWCGGRAALRRGWVENGYSPFRGSAVAFMNESGNGWGDGDGYGAELMVLHNTTGYSVVSISVPIEKEGLALRIMAGALTLRHFRM